MTFQDDVSGIQIRFEGQLILHDGALHPKGYSYLCYLSRYARAKGGQ